MAAHSVAIGAKFGRLTVIGDGEPKHYPSGQQHKTVICVCECGTSSTYLAHQIKNGKTKSCGCLLHDVLSGRREQLIPGTKFGRLTIIGVSTPGIMKNGSRPSRSNVICDCGNETVVLDCKLKNGHTSSCGCLVGEKHKQSGSSEYEIWSGMKQRCLNKRTKNYPKYGGRGIAICERWKKSFQAFIEDMGPRPSRRHSIDRINNDGNYEPGNCRWVTNVEQANNRRRNCLFTFYGKTMTLAQWCCIAQIDRTVVMVRLKRGWSEKEAFWLPVRRLKNRQSIN